MQVRVVLDKTKLLNRRGLGGNKEAQRLLTSEVERLSQPYVPMSSGSGAHLVNRAVVDGTRGRITYPGPYAQFLWHGVVMTTADGRVWANLGESKIPTDIPLNFHGAPMRGKMWTMRMWEDRGQEIINSVANLIGGRV